MPALDKSVIGNTGSTTTAPSTKAVYDFAGFAATQVFTSSETGYRALLHIYPIESNGSDVLCEFEVICASANCVPTVIRVSTDNRRNESGNYIRTWDKTIINKGTSDGDVQLWTNNTDGREAIVAASPSKLASYSIKLIRAVGHNGADLSNKIKFLTEPQPLLSNPPGNWSFVNVRVQTECIVKNHASTGTEFGAADSTHYGHTMLSTSITTDSASNAKAATPKAVADWTGGYKISVNPGGTPGSDANTLYFC
jgi:hypothetical protein